MDEVLAHYRELAAATDIPLNADFENGFADDPDEVAENVTRCIATGVAGLSIEDSPQQSATPLYEFDAALARVKAARAAIDKAGGDVVFTARTEGFIRGRPDIDETIRRLKAFADAGADCLYSPGIKTREHIEATVKAVGGKAINFLNSGAFGFTVSDLAGMGVRRISVGGSLARVAMHAFIKTATRIAKDGKFDSFAGIISNAELNKFFGEDRKNVLMSRRHDRAAGRRRRSIPTPALLPGTVTLEGRYGTVERLAPRGIDAASVDGDARPRRDLDLSCRPRPVRRSGGVRRLDRRPCEPQQGAVSSTPWSMPAAARSASSR